MRETTPPRGLRRDAFQRPLIVGSTGQVGTMLTESLGAQGATVLRTSRAGLGMDASLDLAALPDGVSLAATLDALAPDLVVCAGAMTWVDGCEADPEAAWASNVTGPARLAAYAHARELPFVSFSSDYVFAGTADRPGLYIESDAPEPLSVYGVTKLEGERAILQEHTGALILRTSWVYGPDRAGKNFISSLVRQLRAGQRVRVPSDQVSTPTLNADLADATLALLQAGATGVVHVAGPELMSRYELALRVADYFELPKGLVEGIATRSLGQLAARPLHSGLQSERLAALLPKFRFCMLKQGLQRTAELLSEPHSPVGTHL